MTKAQILLADDHAVVRSGIRNALRELDEVEVIGEVGNGIDLFTALAQHQPDCLLIDVTMPNFDPIAAIAHIRKMYPDMRILVVSAYDDDVYVQGLLGVGVDGYHLKDQPLSDLRLAVQRVLAGERWVSSRLVERLVRLGDQPRVESHNLTQRQREILRLLHQGLDNRHIAAQLNLSVKTIENHLTRLYKQLDVRSRLEAVNYVMQRLDLLATSPGEKPSVNQPTTHASRPLLIVDDNARYRGQLVKMILSIVPGALVYEAGNSDEALLYIQNVQPRLVMVDVVLGDENGIQLVRRISGQAPYARVILFSAYPDSEFHRLGMEAGAIAFLDKKNIDIATLRQMLDDNGLL